jgi:hypothetical protein
MKPNNNTPNGLPMPDWSNNCKQCGRALVAIKAEQVGDASPKTCPDCMYYRLQRVSRLVAEYAPEEERAAANE